MQATTFVCIYTMNESLPVRMNGQIPPQRPLFQTRTNHSKFQTSCISVFQIIVNLASVVLEVWVYKSLHSYIIIHTMQVTTSVDCFTAHVCTSSVYFLITTEKESTTSVHVCINTMQVTVVCICLKIHKYNLYILKKSNATPKQAKLFF
jgi:hypothetical protein